MHVFFLHRWVRLLIAAFVVGSAPSTILAQEGRDGNFRRTYDGQPTNAAPANSYASQAASPRQSLPLMFRQRDESSTTVIRGNGSTNTALPLAPPKDRRSQKPTSTTPPSVKGSITTVLSSLAMVLGAFFLVAWFARRANPNTTAVLPKDVVETLGRTSMGNRQYLQLVRLGSKLLLLSVSPHGTETLTEVTSPDEVDRLTALCQQHQPGSVTTTFRSILAQLGNEPTTPGFLGNEHVDELELASTTRGRRARLRVREDDHD